jgi:predicted ABC-type ATPase
MRRKPWLWLLAGPNGAGKSTYAPNLRADVEEIVGPDELAYQIARRAPQRAALRAGRLAVQRRNDLLRQRRSFGVETTIAGRGYLTLVQRATREGWSIGIVYIGLGSPELAIERVRERVRQGGHYVPPEDVRRRYHRSLNNLALIYQTADRLIVLDNSSVKNRMLRVLEVERGRVLFRRPRLPKWLGTAFRGKLPPRSKRNQRKRSSLGKTPH